MSVIHFGSADLDRDEEVLLERFRRLTPEQRDSVIQGLPKAAPSIEEKKAKQEAFIREIAGDKPLLVVVPGTPEFDDLLSGWGEPVVQAFEKKAEMCGTTEEGKMKRNGILTVISKDFEKFQTRTPYVQFTFNEYAYSFGRRSGSFFTFYRSNLATTDGEEDANTAHEVASFQKGGLDVSWSARFDTLAADAQPFVVGNNIQVYVHT